MITNTFAIHSLRRTAIEDEGFEVLAEALMHENNKVKNLKYVDHVDAFQGLTPPPVVKL